VKRQQFAYEKLTQILRAQILSGFIKPGEYIMSENELCRYYGLSRTSVRRALELLAKEGLIVRNVGQGTMVALDLVVRRDNRKTLHIMRPFASHYGDNVLPLLIGKFAARHPHVEVKVLSLPPANFWGALRECAAMGLHPDIVLASDRQFKELERPADFLDLRPIFDRYADSVYGKLLEPFRQDGQIKAAPVTFSTVYLAYNPNLFQRYGVPLPEPDWTLEAFKRAAAMLTRDTNGDGICDVYGFLLSSSFLRWPLFALQNGVRFTEAERQPDLVLKTLTMLHDLLYKERVATLSQPGVQRVNSDAFLKEKAAMVLTTTFEMADWRNENPGFRPETATLPFGNTQATLLLTDALMISPNCADVELACDFVRMAIDVPVQEDVSRETGFLSVHRDVNERIWTEPSRKAMNIDDGRLERGYFLYELFPDPGMLEQLEEQMELFWSGLESAEQFRDCWLRLKTEGMATAR